MSLAAVKTPSDPLIESLRAEAREAPPSGIVEVRDYGWGREGLIPLWVGEGDLPTPSFISETATRALAAGETFYTYQRGIPELRQALADYHTRVYGGSFSPERFFVTGGGMQAVQIALRMVAGAGDEVLLPTPAWPNFRAAMELNGAKAVPVKMELKDRAWTLDLDRLAAAVTPRTRALFINSPANPTGWTATRDELAQILALARKHGLWIIADEIYGRFVFDGSARAPSFHDVMAEDDRIIFVQTFSKNWAMTGWRIGWLETSPKLGAVVENLIQYSTSGVATFMQRAAITALERGESFLEHQIARARTNRDLLENGLGSSNRISFARTNGAFYFFFSVAGFEDSMTLAKELIDKAGVGLAPGSAFGPGAEKYLRLCFARRSDHIEETVRRIAGFLT
ncbi:pyridoxal phosphate-dependent aminotransferase [Terrarubrum flagellatum]|uniref:pyridoxal phosphate-dependent aminotransferase n=1 Tax=Terrirubrum flagellatum TaxID=2895980 RepID=UPI0031450841